MLDEFSTKDWLEKMMKSEGYLKLREFQTRKVNAFAQTCFTKDISEREADYARGAMEGYACDIFDELLKELQTNKELEKLNQEAEKQKEG